MAPAALALVLCAWSPCLPAGAEPQPEPNPDFPSTEIRLGWLRHEHQHPDQPSPRPQPKHDKLVRNNFDSLRLAIADLTKTFGSKYPQGGTYLKRLEQIEQAVLDTPVPLAPLAATFDTLLKEALLANPLIDFDSLMFIDRQGSLAPSAWLNLAAIRPTGHDNVLKVLSPVSPDGKVTTLFTPPNKAAIARMDLHFDGTRLLYSSNGKTPPDCWGTWQISEVDVPPKLDPATHQPITREIATIPDKDVDNFDACYGPDGSIYFTSTATQLGVPCIRGSSPIAQLFRKKPAGTIERLTFDQDHNWHPSLLPNGRIMYLRWDYTDTPHCFNRVVFSMNPDGTDQAAIYGSNSYWPNGIFYPRAVPGSMTKFVGIVTGHHDWGQIGHLVLFDTTKSRFEADGVVQQIPGYGKKVIPVMQDALIGGLYPLFVTPYPLSDKYFIAGMKTNNPEGWGTDIYLVDIFDNALKLYGVPGRWMIEPVPLRKRPPPPVIPDRTIKDATTATVVMSDVYVGDGLKDVPRGKVKSLRIFSYNFAMRGMGGQVDRIGVDGPWDVRVIVGTVPVEADGSANFTVPARVPLAVQPLDAEGKALQYMRSWFTCQPGEVRSCVGCHESANTAPPSQMAKAALRKPSTITPWYGPMRGFSFNREVQPALDKYCVGCHYGATQLVGRDGGKIADLTLRPDEVIILKNGVPDPPAHFPPAYYQLLRFVRNATMESDLHMLPPYDVHADQTRLVQLLKKGHHGVKLDAEGWDRLITWIDMNIPAHGSWNDIVGSKLVAPVHARRKDLMQRYAHVDFDPEDIGAFTVDAARPKITPVMPAAPPRPASIRAAHPLQVEPHSLTEATDPQTGKPRERIIPLTKEVSLRLVRIPAGTFVMGDAAGYEDEWNERPVKIEKPFWMGVFEVTNQQYALFNPQHDSRLEVSEFLHFSGGERGTNLNQPLQPVVRIAQTEALAFCRWLSQKTGEPFTLPSEEQWEWAARYGKCDPNGLTGKDFSKLANLADKAYYSAGNVAVPLTRRIAVENIDDGYQVSAPVGHYAPNEAGLYDMIGNVAEWTTSKWQPTAKGDPQVVARGGSWQDIPYRARPASRAPYRSEMKVVDVGFRLIIPTDPGPVVRSSPGMK